MSIRKSLSVIVPVYNMAAHIRECLDSICAQTDADLEIVLVDDGSTDGSGAICEEYAGRDRRVRVLHQENLGVLRARHNGLLACDSTYVTFVDADDWLDADAYERTACHRENGVDVIVFGKILERGERGRTFPKSNYAFGAYSRAQIEQNLYPTLIWDVKNSRTGITQSLCDKIIKRELLLASYALTEKIGKLHYGEDPLILYPLMQWAQSVYIMEENPYHYRKETDELPAYLRNDDFFDKLYIWYRHLTAHVTEIPGARKQIEYLYLYLAEARKDYYGDIAVQGEYMFPFELVSAGSKIVLWGAGKVGRIYRGQIERLHYCDVVAWVDSNDRAYGALGVQNTEIVDLHLEFDYIVIAIYSKAVKDAIAEQLKQRGIPDDKIVWHDV